MKNCDEIVDLEQCPEYHEAQRLARVIGETEGMDPDHVLTDALLVATIAHLEAEGVEPCGRAVWHQMDYTSPGEVRDVLATRLNEPSRYWTLPGAVVAGSTSDALSLMSEAEISELAELAEQELNRLDA